MEIFSVLATVFVLITVSAICSGLNIALVSLDLANLERKATLGNVRAIRVLPLRRNIHLTLASILLTNVAAASTLPLVLHNSFGSVAAGASSTLLLVIFGEILPQAVFARHALNLYSFFIWPIRLMIIATYPLSKPLQLLLDKILGHHGIQLHSRHELGILVSEHLGEKASELDADEVEIIRGALQLSEKRVREIMTPLKHTYWLTPDTLVDKQRIEEIQTKSWSRIPVFSDDLTVCHGVILMKDLVNINFHKFPVPVRDLPLHPTKLVGSMTALDTMFRKFISARTHLIPVEKDDVIIGVVTIEDLLEEILGHEIIDEADHRTKRK